MERPGIPAVQGCDLCNTDVTVSPWKDDLKVFGLTVNYKAGFGTFTATSNQFNRNARLHLRLDAHIGVVRRPVPAESWSRRAADNYSELRFASHFGTGKFRRGRLTASTRRATGNRT